MAFGISIVTGGTATRGTGAVCAPGDDYIFYPGTTVITQRAAGGRVAKGVEVCNDAVAEQNETFTLRIDSGTGYTVGTQSTTTVTIKDDDHSHGPAPGKPTLTASPR